MNVRTRYRPGTPEDLVECVNCARDSFSFDDSLRSKALAWWKNMLLSGRASFSLIENIAAPVGHQIEFFFFFVWVTDNFVEYLVNQAPPVILANVLLNESNFRDAFLTFEQIQEANSGDGLNMLCLNSGSPWLIRDIDCPDRDRMASLIIEANQYISGGFRVKRAIVEFYDDYQFAWAQGWGGKVYRDHTEYVRAHPECLGAKSKRPPRLYMAVSDDKTRIGTSVSQNFSARTPIFDFSQAEREQLLYALTFENDNELADRLHLSRSAVRKRWESIYNKIDGIDRAMILGDIDATDSSRQTRVYKRKIIDFIRYHMEEVRPYKSHKNNWK